ncbi:hypothetical protein VOLCADRAFT_106055 [Volvox carteri f. nagariensis]|uniref:DUF4281 domain-containing protein n=1 Tax=Volvox carteri f. nagariensis TaxID=3068 RepID=D8U4T2_VOLCA|nr:uncharacterized protein VOLCADRAFT_106055 [Volvox carteri f. nagariensis]EFJ45242.1 hypothetical protein VOLCADRAFT_106055 [Volvox carteri f. nagariensis]|eukprot:XP_002953618.1 hypothetical protein VOLCADRAFT_106055 [Volvox carteri f. nagariensis]
MPIYGLSFTDEQLFNLINIALPGWVLLAVAPRWRLTQLISAVAAVLVSGLYTALLLTFMIAPNSVEKLDFSDMMTYEGVVRTLSKRTAVLPCWVHYVAFDLWVGRWMAADSLKRRVPQLLLIPCLFATLFAGPAGLLLYHLVRLPFAGPMKARSSTKSKSA